MGAPPGERGRRHCGRRLAVKRIHADSPQRESRGGGAADGGGCSHARGPTGRPLGQPVPVSWGVVILRMEKRLGDPGARCIAICASHGNIPVRQISESPRRRGSGPPLHHPSWSSTSPAPAPTLPSTGTGTGGGPAEPVDARPAGMLDAVHMCRHPHPEERQPPGPSCPQETPLCLP